MNSLLNELEKYLKPPIEIKKGTQQGWTSTVFELRNSEGEYILKICENSKYKEWLREETEVLKGEKISFENLVPKYIAFFYEREYACLLMTKLPGHNLTQALKSSKNDTERLRLIESFGTFLKEFHEQPILNNHLQNNWLDERLHQAKVYAENGLCDGSLELWMKLNNKRPKPIKSTWIHGDCTTDNVMVYSGKVIAFIDVAFMKIGDSRYDEALAIRKFSDKEKEAFYRGYKCYKIDSEEFEYFNNGLYEFF